MRGSRQNGAPGALEKPQETIFDVATVRRMLPLVRRIMNDYLIARRELARLTPEQNRLDRMRRTLAWPERARRYQIHEDIALQEQVLLDAMAELEVLGLTLLEPDQGRLGFPTVVNNRRAFFCWQPDEEDLNSWHFAGETTIRHIPASWCEAMVS